MKNHGIYPWIFIVLIFFLAKDSEWYNKLITMIPGAIIEIDELERTYLVRVIAYDYSKKLNVIKRIHEALDVDLVKARDIKGEKQTNLAQMHNNLPSFSID